MWKYILGVLLVIFTLNQCAYVETTPEKVPNKSEMTLEIDSIEFEKHIATLSSDYFLGRMPFSEGEKRTIEYLSNTLNSYGLMKGQPESFLQKVPLVEINGHPSSDMNIYLSDMVLGLELSKDFMVHSERPVENVKLEQSPLVFCGYGIVAPEYNWNDYAGIDMKGKTAVVLVNDPGLGGEDSTFFKGDIMTYYGRWTYKYEEADRQGAAGLLLIHVTQMAGYPWHVVSSSWSGPQLHLDEVPEIEDCGVKGWIHFEKAKDIAEFCGYNLSNLIKSARQPGFKPVDLGAMVDVSIQNDLKKNSSSNVIAWKKGSLFPDEYIIYTAHWDHLGVGAPIDGDSIYNGALDNASGTALLLSMAKTISMQNWERSVIFAFVTAEEQGLLGSSWYTQHPLFPIEKTVANINIDGINLIGKARDLTVTGLGHSELDGLAKEIAGIQGRYVQGEEEPEKGYFFRSDHFNFAKVGIPPLYAAGGNDHYLKGKKYAKEIRDEFTQNNYHMPSDEYKATKWNLTGALQDGELMLEVGNRLCNSRNWPKWNDSSEFKEADRRQFINK